MSSAPHPEPSRIDAYRRLCDEEPSIPLFSQAWWLDAVCEPGDWDVALVRNGERIVGAMPFFIADHPRMTLLHQPPLTQTLGPWLAETEASGAQRLAREKDILQALIDALPAFDDFRQRWHHSRANWLPFYWQGFTQTTRYTYRLPDLSDADALWKGFGSNIRGDVRKAGRRFGLEAREDYPLADCLGLIDMTYARQGLERQYSARALERIDAACSARNARKIIAAVDADGTAHACAYIVWDSNSAYYLASGADPSKRNSGAGSLCLWTAIQAAARVTRSFDFEGSMLEPVERHFRSYGSEQTPYFEISKTPSRSLRARRALRDLLGAIR